MLPQGVASDLTATIKSHEFKREYNIFDVCQAKREFVKVYFSLTLCSYHDVFLWCTNWGKQGKPLHMVSVICVSVT